MNKKSHNAVIRFNGVAVALSLALSLSAVAGAASAQVVADPAAGGPRVQDTLNGAQVVDINPANQAGVSRNQYSQFDVGRPGVVLNNATGYTGTNLAGAVAGNANLGGVPARVILNEVTSGRESLLTGNVEVAGQRAQVIIANPSGINVQGGGFLNASRVTLTTGTPVFGTDGAIVGYDVTGGKVRVTESDQRFAVDSLGRLRGRGGLIATDVDYTDIIAKSVELNHFIYGKSVNVVAGANSVKLDGAGAVQQVETRSGVASAQGVELSIGELGGMYANDIVLVGTSDGLGVRNAGSLTASRSLKVVTNGQLTNELGRFEAPVVHIEAQDGIANHGQVFAGRQATLLTAGKLDNTYGTISAGRIDAQAGSLSTQYGGIFANEGTLKIAGDYNTEGGNVWGVERSY